MKYREGMSLAEYNKAVPDIEPVVLNIPPTRGPLKIGGEFYWYERDRIAIARLPFLWAVEVHLPEVLESLRKVTLTMALREGDDDRFFDAWAARWRFDAAPWLLRIGRETLDDPQFWKRFDLACDIPPDRPEPKPLFDASEFEGERWDIEHLTRGDFEALVSFRKFQSARSTLGLRHPEPTGTPKRATTALAVYCNDVWRSALKQGWRPMPQHYKLELYEWLVRHHVGGETFAKIAAGITPAAERKDRDLVRANQTKVRKGVNEIARDIVLPLV